MDQSGQRPQGRVDAAIRQPALTDASEKDPGGALIEPREDEAGSVLTGHDSIGSAAVEWRPESVTGRQQHEHHQRYEWRYTQHPVVTSNGPQCEKSDAAEGKSFQDPTRP